MDVDRGVFGGGAKRTLPPPPHRNLWANAPKKFKGTKCGKEGEISQKRWKVAKNVTYFQISDLFDIGTG